jgi:hypothetical protein
MIAYYYFHNFAKESSREIYTYIVFSALFLVDSSRIIISILGLAF